MGFQCRIVNPRISWASSRLPNSRACWCYLQLSGTRCLPSGIKSPLFHGFFWAPLSEVSSNYVVLVEQRARSFSIFLLSAFTGYVLRRKSPAAVRTESSLHKVSADGPFSHRDSFVTNGGGNFSSESY